MPLPFDAATALAALPKIKGPVQLAAFIFTVFAATVIYHVDPGNIASLSTVGAIGIAMLAIPLAFHPSLLKLIPPTQRATLLLLFVALFLVSFGSMAALTVKALWSPSPKTALFDSRLAEKSSRFLQLANGKSRVELTWELFPLTKDSSEGATVFTGIVTLHDEDKIEKGGTGTVSEKTCAMVPSCVGTYAFKEFMSRPIFVRGGAPIVPLRTSVDFTGSPKNLRVWWEFYQREGGKGMKCGIDNEKLPPADGIPFLAMYDSNNQKVSTTCHNSTDRVSIPVVYVQ
jgi:hypothetical protein